DRAGTARPPRTTPRRRPRRTRATPSSDASWKREPARGEQCALDVRRGKRRAGVIAAEAATEGCSGVAPRRPSGPRPLVPGASPPPLRHSIEAVHARDDDDPRLGHLEAPAVALVVEADLATVRDPGPLVDDHAPEPRSAA